MKRDAILNETTYYPSTLARGISRTPHRTAVSYKRLFRKRAIHFTQGADGWVTLVTLYSLSIGMRKRSVKSLSLYLCGLSTLAERLLTTNSCIALIFDVHCRWHPWYNSQSTNHTLCCQGSSFCRIYCHRNHSWQKLFVLRAVSSTT